MVFPIMITQVRQTPDDKYDNIGVYPMTIICWIVKRSGILLHM